MPWNGTGVFNRLYSWVADKNAGIDITSSRMDADTNDIVTGLENTVTLDGQTIPTHSLPMGGFNHTNVGNATARTNYPAAGQVQDSILVWGGTSGGSANTQTISLTPIITAYVAGQRFAFLAGFTNNGAATLNVNAVGAASIRKPGSSGPVVLTGNEIIAGNIVEVEYDGTYFILIGAPPSSSFVIRGYISGLGLSTAGSSSTFAVAAGVAADSTNVSMMSLASSLNKTTSAWAVGNNQGALDTGSIATSTWYHVFEIIRLDTGVVDILVSLSATAPTLPANYTLFRRIGSLLTDGSSHWVLFSQNGDEFLWSIPLADIATSTLGTAATLFTLTVPPGVKVNARMRGSVGSATIGVVVLINSPDEAVAVADAPLGNATGIVQISTSPGAALGDVNVRTNTSGQVRVVASAASTSLVTATFGWFDSRGRFL